LQNSVSSHLNALQNFSGRSRAYNRYTPTAAAINSGTMYSIGLLLEALAAFHERPTSEKE
jgi:hypothetical protein